MCLQFAHAVVEVVRVVPQVVDSLAQIVDDGRAVSGLSLGDGPAQSVRAGCIMARSMTARLNTARSAHRLELASSRAQLGQRRNAADVVAWMWCLQFDPALGNNLERDWFAVDVEQGSDADTGRLRQAAAERPTGGSAR